MSAEPNVHRAGIPEMVALGDEFNDAIEKWNQARHAGGDVRLEMCVGVASWQMALAMFIWESAQEVECTQGPVNTGESVQKAMDAKPFDSEVGVLDEWASILEAAKAQDIKWKIAMPTLDSEHGVYVWALKSQEEMGELSAALLARIGNRRIPEDTALEECDQLIAVLLRVRTLLRKE